MTPAATEKFRERGMRNRKSSKSFVSRRICRTCAEHSITSASRRSIRCRRLRAKWGTFDITAKGNSFTVILNGQKTVDNAIDAKSMFSNGKIGLQHGLGNKDANGGVNDRGVVKFGTVEIRPL